MSLNTNATTRLINESLDEKSECSPPKSGTKPRLQGEAVKLAQPEPWPEPVEGAIILTNTAEAIQRHMAMREVDTYVVALWCAHTHIFEVFGHTPRLAITAPAAECGKSVLLNLVSNLVSKPMEADNISPAPFFRLAASQQPTFLIDEVDVWLKEDSDLRGALNNGWQRNGQVIRCVGDSHEVRAFGTHTPVALVGIQLPKKLKETTLTRSIVVELTRALPEEVIEYYDQRKHRKVLGDLCRQLARWTTDNSATLAACDPTLPPGVLNRRADKWRPLFAIAESAGGVWPERVKRALLAEDSANTYTREVQLLHDIAAILADGTYEPGIFTDELIDALCGTEESNWAEYNFRQRDAEDKKITSRQLAKLLKDYKCVSEAIRRSDGRRRGYHTNQLQAAIQRYLPH